MRDAARASGLANTRVCNAYLRVCDMASTSAPANFEHAVAEATALLARMEARNE